METPLPPNLIDDRIVLTPLEQKAWKLYCDEGSMSAVDFWHELPEHTQQALIYRVQTEEPVQTLKDEIQSAVDTLNAACTKAARMGLVVQLDSYRTHPFDPSREEGDRVDFTITTTETKFCLVKVL